MKDPDINDRARRDGADSVREFIDGAAVVNTGRGRSRPRAGKGQSSDATYSFPFLTFDEASAGAVAKPWLLKGLLARGETSAWIGAPGSLKSALLTDIAVCVAANRSWYERLSKGPAAVIYFALERANLVRRRLAAYRTRHGLESLPIAVVANLVNLMDAATVETVVATIEAVEKRRPSSRAVAATTTRHELRSLNARGRRLLWAFPPACPLSTSTDAPRRRANTMASAEKKRRSPTVWRKPATDSSPLPACRRASGAACAPPTRSNGYMRSLSAGSKRRLCCHRRTRPPCCFGRCLLPVR